MSRTRRSPSRSHNPPADASAFPGVPRVIALAGMMGSGKSAVGVRLAGRLGRRFVDLDRAIAQQAGMTIPDLFARHGEAAFRAAERDALDACLADPEALVVSLGGGAYIQPAVREALRGAAFTVFLDVPEATLVQRLAAGGTAKRPLLAHPDWRRRLSALLAERLPVYRQADRTLAVAPEESPDETAERLLRTFLPP